MWAEVTEANRFEAHERVALTHSLRWFTRSDAYLVASETAEGREQSRLVRQAMNASTCGLRFWRALKWTSGEPARLPGRQPGEDWSPLRRQQAGR